MPIGISVGLLLSLAGADEAPVTKLPVLKSSAEAVYPADALKDRIEAVVVLELDIDKTGAVVDALVVSSSTVAENPQARTATSAEYVLHFVQSAKRAAKQLVFEPAEVGGKPVPVRLKYTVRFKLPELKVATRTATSATSTAAVAEEKQGPGVENFTGVVRERGTRARLPGVVVTVYRTEADRASGYEAITDREGRFKFVDLPEGQWKVVAETEGYFPFRTEETIRAGEAVDVTYYVEKGVYSRYDVEVLARRPRKEVTRRTLSAQEIVSVPGTFNDPVLAVSDLPGVARPQFGSGEVIVRGSAPQDTALLIDGIRVPLLFHFGGLRSVLPADMIDGFDFFPGNFSVNYGGVTGGVLDVHSKHIHPDQVHGSADVNLLDAALEVEIPLGKDAAVAVAGRRSYADAILKAVIPKDATVSFNTLPRYYDYQVLGRWNPSREHDVRVFFFGSDDKIALLFKNPTDIDVQLQSGSLSGATAFQRLALEYTFTSEKFRNLARVALGDDSITAQFFGGQFKFDIESKSIHGRDLATYTFNDAFALSAGFETTYSVNDIGIRAPRPPKEGDTAFNQNLNDVLETTLNGAVIFGLGPFIEAEVKPIEHLAIVPALRLDYFYPIKAVTLDPRIVVRYDLDPEWTVKGGIGLVHQAPQPDETDKSFGNPDLGPIQGVHYSVGTEWRPETWLNFDATLFYKDLSHLVSRSDAVVMRDGMTVPQVYDNNGLGRVYGLELYVRHEFAHNLIARLAYTLSRSERKDSGATTYRLFEFDQTHIFNLIATYAFAENWSLGIRWRIISGNPSTPYIGGTFLSDFDRFAPVPAPAYSSRLPLFHQLDVRLSKRWVYDAWSLLAYLDIVNSYNHGNVEAIVYNFDYTQSKTQTGFPIFPILGLRADL